MTRNGLLRVVGASAVVIGAVVAALWFLGSSTGARDRFSTLRMVPEDVSFYAAINTEPASSQWIAAANVLDSVRIETPLREAWSDLLSRQNVNWDEDLVSTLGSEGYIAVTDFGQLDRQRGAVVVFELRDARRARQLFLKLVPDALDERGERLEQRTYQGQTIHLVASDVTYGVPYADWYRPYAVSFVNDVVVIGLSESDVQGVIDVIQGRARNVLSNKRFEELRSQQHGDFLLWGYVDLSAVWNTLHGRDLRFDTQPALDVAREQFDRATFTLTARADGLTLDASVLRAPGAAEPLLSTNVDTRYAGKLPSDTMSFAASKDLYNQLYRPLWDRLADTRITTDESCYSRYEQGRYVYSCNTSDDPLRQIVQRFESNAGLSLERDLLSLMTGEAAVAFDARNFNDGGDIGLVGMFDVTDPARATQALERVAQYLEREKGWVQEGVDQSGLHRVAFNDYSSDEAAWSVNDGEAVVGYPYDSVSKVVHATGQNSLADSDDWKTTMSLLPRQKTLVGYVNVRRFVEELEQDRYLRRDLADATDDRITFDELRRIRTIGLAVTKIDGGLGVRVVLLTGQ